ncbi:MAG: hypothetical protein KAF91_16435 [Nostoc sp. TH1S01]|nr:hypothetical protein [Nostoc sp. TH1S01]
MVIPTLLRRYRFANIDPLPCQSYGLNWLRVNSSSPRHSSHTAFGQMWDECRLKLNKQSRP